MLVSIYVLIILKSVISIIIYKILQINIYQLVWKITKYIIHLLHFIY